MAQANPPAATQRRPVTYSALATFWALVLGASAAGGITLQLMGPAGPNRTARAAELAQAQSPAHGPAAGLAPGSVPGSAPGSGAETFPADAGGKKRAAIPAPNPDLLEDAPSDMPELAGTKLPKVADDKHNWPAKYYAAAFDPTDRNPRLTLVVSGAGRDTDLTLRLLHDVPPAVDIVFSAYTPPDQAGTLAQAARDTGHECLLSIPMEPTNAPMVDEGPKQLVSGTSDDQLQQNLFWSLSRQGACVGATGAADNGMRGDRFAADPYFTSMLVEITRRGLLYLDPLTHAPTLYPAGLDAPDLPEPGRIDLVRKADLIMDESVSYDEPLKDDEIRRNLDDLARRADPNNPPIGVAVNLNPRLIDIIHDWARGLPAKGVTLVPLTATPKMQPPGPPVVLGQDPNNPNK